MSKATLLRVDSQELEQWRSHPVTKQLWHNLSVTFNPWAALETCNPEDTKFHQGQVKIFNALKRYIFEEQHEEEK